MSKGLYVHVPFCDHICSYCDFVRCKYSQKMVDEWLICIGQDLAHIQDKKVKTIYIGGGTPSSLSYIQLKKLLTFIQPFTKNVVEYTMEANADSLTEDKIALLKQYGINRISMGAQTFQTDLLQMIQRVADYTMIQNCITTLHKYGISNISIDLMYGLPRQSLSMFQEDLQQAMQLDIQHISLYALTIEPNSIFGKNQVPACDEDLEADFYEYAIAFLEMHGFEQYEISSFAKNKNYSQHNMMYWQYQDFYGIGCGASGKLGNFRYDNTKNINQYIKRNASSNVIALSKEDRMFEMIMMGLRMKQGISLRDFKRRFHLSFEEVFKESLKKHIELHNLLCENQYVKTTKQGMFCLHSILVDFLIEEEEKE